MTDLPARPANRLRKPSWHDSRLVVGVILVLLSVAAGGVLVAQADHRVPVLVAQADLVPGDRLTADNTRVVPVQLGDGLVRYLAGTTRLGDRYVLRPVRRGELIAASGVGVAADLAVQPLTVMADATSATALVRGSVVDVYVNIPKGGSSEGYAGSERVLTTIAVADRPAPASGLGTTSDRLPVRILVPRERVNDLVNHLDDGSRITLVPIPGSLTAGPGS